MFGWLSSSPPNPHIPVTIEGLPVSDFDSFLQQKAKDCLSKLQEDGWTPVDLDPLEYDGVSLFYKEDGELLSYKLSATG